MKNAYVTRGRGGRACRRAPGVVDQNGCGRSAGVSLCVLMLPGRGRLLSAKEETNLDLTSKSNREVNNHISILIDSYV